MAIDYPSDLRAPLNTVVKSQTPTFRVSQPLSGPAYLDKTSTDAPVIYDLTFKFKYVEESLRFRAWVEVNDIYRGVEFNCPIRHEGIESGNTGGNPTQLVRVVEGDIRSSTTQFGSAYFTYTARVQCRKEVTGLEDYYDLINEGGAYLLDGREPLDISINISAPEA
jgi:hypothetical protein